MQVYVAVVKTFCKTTASATLSMFPLSMSLHECPGSLMTSSPCPHPAFFICLICLLCTLNPCPGRHGIYFYFNCHAGHVWNVPSSCIIHGHYWRSVCKSAPLDTLETAAESRALINWMVSFPERRTCSAFWGELTVPWICWAQSCLWRRSPDHFICHWMHVLKWDISSRFDPLGFKTLFRPKHWSRPCWSYRRIVGFQINK